MSTLVTAPAASALVVVDEKGRATLTEIARTTGKPLSTIQRAVDGLLNAGVLERVSPRGPVQFVPTAPRTALRDLATWRLGASVASAIADRAHEGDREAFAPPSTVRNPAIRQAWPNVMHEIVSKFDPVRVVVFGSQARGDARPDSDLDLLVVFDELDDRRERRVGIHRLLRGMPFAKDILVATNEDLSRPFIGSALAAAVREGVTVYER